ncbi:NAD(P) transhydrogenase subunit alpha [Cellulomonas fimi]|uniref:proton-translocating NAD(P)(+) transhydrogenase n=1 Tax=Cellulomonas fimi TaxID=1708 RepID=A0A7Y0QIL2_CELFI|nr:NAD(P) transhydrogenase subunit alpha [Cellulomonas fimi]NMR21333.1 NAD(P) transhydrogenase subunit alpha [Cellulomonas fimi]
MTTPDQARVLVVAAITEREPGERRVALVPEVVERLVAQGFEVLVESGAGAGALHADDSYVTSGAKVGSLDEVVERADVVLVVRRPPPETLARLRPGQVLVGLLDARGDRADLDTAVARGVHVLSLDLLPRTLSRAQTMDALTSQASVAGYRAAIVAAEAFGRYFPMMITAAGTARPATVLVLGAGVAGLQAIGTARRLGAQVTGYDVRPAARGEVTSLGAAFLATTVTADGGDGYARALTPEESAAQRAELDAAIRRFDVVITTAQVPGGAPPVLVSAETVAAMAPGSVLVDLAAGPWGGNVAGSVPDERVVTPGGVTVIGAGNLPAQMATGASAAYARNVTALLAAVVADGAVTLDPDDDVVGAVWVRPEGAA